MKNLVLRKVAIRVYTLRRKRTSKHTERYAVKSKKKATHAIVHRAGEGATPKRALQEARAPAPAGAACWGAQRVLLARGSSRSVRESLTQGHEWQLPKPATAGTKALTIRDTTEVCAGKIIRCLRFTLKY